MSSRFLLVERVIGERRGVVEEIDGEVRVLGEVTGGEVGEEGEEQNLLLNYNPTPKHCRFLCKLK